MIFPFRYCQIYKVFHLVILFLHKNYVLRTMYTQEHGS